MTESLRGRLEHPDATVRLDAAREAGRSGDVGLIDVLPHLAMHDGAEVRTIGGVAEMYETVGQTAADALRRLLSLRPGVDPQVRDAVSDLTLDDDRAATLVCYLGALGEPLRQELTDRAEGRLRLRAARSVRSIHRTADYVARFLPDPFPAVRAEALDVPRNVGRAEDALRLLREDPAAEVRLAAARALRFAPVGVEPFVAAAEHEDDARVRAALRDCLTYRNHPPAGRADLVVRLAGGRPVVLTPGRPVPVGRDEQPETAGVEVTCDACGARHRVEGPTGWQYVDDDSSVAAEHGYLGRLTGVCPVGGDVVRAEVRLSLYRSRGDGSTELVWDAPPARDTPPA